MRVVIFAKAFQGDLFQALVPVRGHTRKDGVTVAPHVAHREVRAIVQAPTPPKPRPPPPPMPPDPPLPADFKPTEYRQVKVGPNRIAIYEGDAKEPCCYLTPKEAPGWLHRMRMFEEREARFAADDARRRAENKAEEDAAREASRAAKQGPPTGDLFADAPPPPAPPAVIVRAPEPEHDPLLADLPPGSSFVEGKGAIRGHWAVKVGDDILSLGGYRASKEEAVRSARDQLANERAREEGRMRDAMRLESLRDRLLAGDTPTDSDIAFLNLRPGGAEFPYLSPVVQRVFGIPAHKVRAAMGDALHAVYTDMGAKRWKADPRKALMNAARYARGPAPVPPEIAYDDELKEAMDADEAAAKGNADAVAVFELIRGDVHGVIVGSQSSLDRKLNHLPTDYWKPTFKDLQAAIPRTLALLRKRYGDTVRLYRADAPASEHSPKTRTLRMMADPELTRGFAEGGRKLEAFDVPVSDIVGAITGPNRYHEFIVKKADHHRELMPASDPRLEGLAPGAYWRPGSGENRGQWAVVHPGSRKRLSGYFPTKEAAADDARARKAAHAAAREAEANSADKRVVVRQSVTP